MCPSKQILSEDVVQRVQAAHPVEDAFQLAMVGVDHASLAMAIETLVKMFGPEEMLLFFN